VAPEIYGGDFRKDPSLIEAHAGAMRGALNLGYLYQLLAMTGWTSLPWLWSLPQSTLILMGSDDPLVPAVNGRILAGLIPNAQLRMIDDGHLFIVTRPAETAAIIEAFLADDDSRLQRFRGPILKETSALSGGIGAEGEGQNQATRHHTSKGELHGKSTGSHGQKAGLFAAAN
jgi:hypothetical protein